MHQPSHITRAQAVRISGLPAMTIYRAVNDKLIETEIHYGTVMISIPALHRFLVSQGIDPPITPGLVWEDSCDPEADGPFSDQFQKGATILCTCCDHRLFRIG